MNRQGEDAVKGALMLMVFASIGVIMWIALLPGVSVQGFWDLILGLIP